MTDHHALLSAFRDHLGAMDAPQIAGFIDGFDWNLARRELVPAPVPVTCHLQSLKRDAHNPLLTALDDAADHLQWARSYTSADFGEHFLQNYGWVELFGTRGHFASDAMAGGFLVLGPDVDYPDHHHVAEEIYVPLTDGSLWSRDGEPFVVRDAGEVIHHPSGMNHAMKTQRQPLVALYLWRGGSLAEKPKFARGTP